MRRCGPLNRYFEVPTGRGGRPGSTISGSRGVGARWTAISREGVLPPSPRGDGPWVAPSASSVFGPIGRELARDGREAAVSGGGREGLAGVGPAGLDHC